MTRRLPAALGLAALMLAPAAHADIPTLRCESTSTSSATGVTFYTVVDPTTVRSELPGWGVEPQLLPLEVTPWALVIDYPAGKMRIDRVTGQMYSQTSRDVAAVCAPAILKF